MRDIIQITLNICIGYFMPPLRKTKTIDKPPTKPLGPPNCLCGKAAILQIVKKEGVNKNKGFYCCESVGKSSCGYFEWQAAYITAMKATSNIQNFFTKKKS